MSPYREITLKELKNSEKIPSRIAKNTNISTSHISRALTGLKQKGLVIVLNPEKSQGRLYQITDLGLKVVEKLES
ncbi:winged helix-turn-helix domain-containing protein [Methanobrevibacter arboriphilus]|uniref:winged helix-turn-helix domain-containing protein n=1 Tax=Methanobrevibacter arboriphilus TaxID=39441 RepID=UPI0018D1A634|nr:winged helix-turn-helix domain-containing protein [Methanobrevibacter arboriphilus]